MSNITITNSQDFEKIISKIESSYQAIEQVFQSEKTNMENINETDIWTGKAQGSIYRKYKELEKNFSPIEETLQIYIQFLKNTLSNYKQLEEKVNKNIEDNINSLNINS